jgi:hypothetical protein
MTMMFDERERAAERRYVREGARFHARNRRNQFLATWACARMRLTGKPAEGYITSFNECAVVTDEETLIRRLQSDLRAAGIGSRLASMSASRRMRVPRGPCRWSASPR